MLLLALGSIGFLLIAVLTACSPYFVGWFGDFCCCFEGVGMGGGQWRGLKTLHLQTGRTAFLT